MVANPPDAVEHAEWEFVNITEYSGMLQYFFLRSFVAMLVMLILNLVVIGMYHASGGKRLPPYLRHLLLFKCNGNGVVSKCDVSTYQKEARTDKEIFREEWVKASRVLDGILFGFFSLFAVIFALSYLLAQTNAN